MNYNPQDYPPFAVTVDVLPFAVKNGKVHLLSCTREEPPHKNELALLGGFINPDEDGQTAALRVLGEKGKAVTNHIEQLATFTNPDRDPRMNVISIGYLVFVSDMENIEGTWTVVADENGDCIPDMAFDHREIVQFGLERLRSKLEYTNLASRFLEPKFTISELRSVYETLWGNKLDSPNFQRKLLATEGFLLPTNERKTGNGRPAALYESNKDIIVVPVPFQRNPQR